MGKVTFNGENSVSIWTKSSTVGAESLPTRMGSIVGFTQRPHMPFNMQFPFLATLELSDVSRLTNDPILHFPYWPPVPMKVLTDCPKFEGKVKEDPQAHVMTCHL